MPAQEQEGLVEVYRCTNVMEADRAVVEVLEPADIPAVRRDRVSHAFAAPDTQAGGYFIAVPPSLANKARALLAEGLSDEILDEDAGEII